MVNRLFCTSIKMLYRTLRGVPCTSLNTQQLLKDKRHVQRNTSYPSRFMQEGLIFIYKIAKAEKHKKSFKTHTHTHTHTHFWTIPSSGRIDFRQLTLVCSLLFGLISANSFPLVPENVSDVKWYCNVMCLMGIFLSKGVLSSLVLVEGLRHP